VIVLATLLANPELLDRRAFALCKQSLQIALVLGGSLVPHQVASIAVHGALASAAEWLVRILGRPSEPWIENLEPLFAELLVIFRFQSSVLLVQL